MLLADSAVSDSAQENVPSLNEIISGIKPSQGQTQAAQQQVKQQPPQPPPPQPGQPQQNRQQKKRKSGTLILLTVLVVAIAIGGAAAFALMHKPSKTTTSTTVPTTTVPAVKLAQITGCMNITSPGKYYLQHSIKVKLSQGACLNVTSNNVELIGNGNAINGSGPFSGIPPFTYGIIVGRVQNVTISGFGVYQFSYGIALQGSNGVTILQSNFSKDTMSGIYLNDSSNNRILDSYVYAAASKQGGISIVLGSNNTIENNTIANNAYYGLVLNSTQNRFINDRFLNNPSDMICNATAGVRDANAFYNSSCSSNYYCNFAKCSQINTPLNISMIHLSQSVSSCGGIYSPGVYRLQKDLNAADYLNMSNYESASIPCINVLSPNVKLECGGHAIENSGYGVSIKGLYNDTVDGCTISNSTYGIYIEGDFYPKVQNDSLDGNEYGVFVNNTNQFSGSNITTKENTYGIFINNDSGTFISSFSGTGNKYGVYMNSGNGNSFSNGFLENNTKADFYCSAASYNSTTNLLQSTKCGVTDCNWANCAQHALPPISIYPLSECGAISLPGNYSLESNVASQGTCISINANNVNLNCNGRLLTGYLTGTGISISGSNDSIENCNVVRFDKGVTINNASYASLEYINISGVGSGVQVSNSMYDKIINVAVKSFSRVGGFFFDNVSNSVITSDSAAYGINSTSGFMIVNSSNDLISYDNASSNIGYGFDFVNSNSNNVFNNTAYANRPYDYACNPRSSGLYAELNGVNFGGTKSDCNWLVELTPLTMQPSCYAISSGSQITLTNDMLYPYGATCYNIYNTLGSSANFTTINCNYHTVLATNGGTFVNIVNASNVKIENCFIKDFTMGVASKGSYTNVYNNVFGSDGSAIAISGASYPNIQNNIIMNSSYGIRLENDLYGKFINNSIFDTNVSFEYSGGGASTISSTNAKYGGIGLYIINSTLNILQDNVLENMSDYGIICTGGATNSSSLNKDFGGNICSSNKNCFWMTTSPACKAG
ncbi:MAG: right-handed parallel beta-helix repeat-containing protein [Candidatus Micrarchaeaceae archaeon]